MDYIAHIRSSDQKIQTVTEHLIEVKELAEKYGEKLHIKHLAGLAGMLHDMGKYTDSFLAYIKEAVNNPENPPKRGSVDHATAGGKLLYDLYHKQPKSPYLAILAEIVGNAIISHHSYLHDFITPELDSKYLKRVHEKDIDEFTLAKQLFYKNVMDQDDFETYADKASEELKSYLMNNPTNETEQQLMFLSKFLFSILIDSDRTNSRLFEENSEYDPVNHVQLFQQY